MPAATNPFWKLLRGWSHQQEAALHQMTERRAVGQRLAGFGKSERVDATIFLLAVAPFGLVLKSDLAGWERGTIWHAVFWMSAVWSAATLRCRRCCALAGIAQIHAAEGIVASAT